MKKSIKGVGKKVLASALSAAMVVAFAPAVAVAESAGGNGGTGFSLAEMGVLEKAAKYSYEDGYSFNGTATISGNTVLYSVAMETMQEYDSESPYSALVDDLARFLGAIYRGNGSATTVQTITYGNKTYSWNTSPEELKGSNYRDENGTTLVSAITKDLTTIQSVGTTTLSFAVGDTQVKFQAVVYANTETTLGDKCVAEANARHYLSVESAVADAKAGDTVTVKKNVGVGEKDVRNFWINKDLILDLGGHAITANNQIALGVNNESAEVTVKNGTLNSGTLYSVYSIGSKNLKLENCTVSGDVWVGDASHVTVGAKSIIEGMAVVWGEGITGTEGCKVPTLDVYGAIKNSAQAISTNGTDYSAPVINIYDGATVESTNGTGIYAPANGKITISGGSVIGVSSGIAIKAGSISMTSGSVTATGEDTTPTDGYSNGVNASGAAIQIESNKSYSGNPDFSSSTIEEGTLNVLKQASAVKIDVSGGTISSANGVAFYEYLANNNSTASTSLASLKISGSNTTVTSGSQKNAVDFLFSTQFANSGAAKGFITGGSFAHNPTAYVPETGFSVSSSSLYTVSAYVPPAPSYDPPVTPPAPAPEVGDKGSATLPSTPGDSGTAGSTKVDVTVTDTTATTDSKGNKVDGSVSIDKIETTGASVAIPETITTDKGTFLVTSIPAGAMEGNTTATTVAIPESVTTIGEGAFSNCTALTTVTVPAGVTEIAFGTFAGCTSLETVEIQGEVTQIASNAFSGCESLTEVSIPETVTAIGSGAFSGCSNLTSVTVPAGVATIEANTFAGCSNLTSVEVKGELTEIAADAFNGCESLTSMTVAGTVRPMATRAATSALVIPASVTKIGDRAFKGTGITSVTVPAGVKMGTGVFRDCKQLTKAAVAKGVKTLGSYTFKGCSALKSVTIPGTVTKIERSAFSGCKSLAKVTIPKSVTSIGKNALYGASKVKTLTVNSKKLTKSSVKGALAGSKVTTVKVPKSMLKSYAKVFAKSVVGKAVKVRAI